MKEVRKDNEMTWHEAKHTIKQWAKSKGKEISPETMAYIKGEFKTADTNGNKTISKKEAKAYFAAN